MPSNRPVRTNHGGIRHCVMNNLRHCRILRCETPCDDSRMRRGSLVGALLLLACSSGAGGGRGDGPPLGSFTGGGDASTSTTSAMGSSSGEAEPAGSTTSGGDTSGELPTPSTTTDSTETTGQIDDGMVYVPAGTFMMGCTMEPHCWADEEPLHAVELGAFYVDRTEVSRGDYLSCIETGPCTAPAGDFDGTSDASLPVVSVTWFQAEAYCSWMGKGLPTEAQWEKAARGTEAATYPWGMGAPACGHVNYGACGNGALPVDSLPEGASPYGALQMSGNVWEWVADWYGETYYASSPASNPPGPDTGDEKVLKGGAFGSNEIARLSVARRFIDVPAGSNSNRGFRCVAPE